MAKLRVAARASPRRCDEPAACPRIRSVRTDLGSRPPLAAAGIRPCVAAPSLPRTCTHFPHHSRISDRPGRVVRRVLCPPAPTQRRLQQCHSSTVTCRNRRRVPRLASRRSFQRPPRGGGGTADRGCPGPQGCGALWAASRGAADAAGVKRGVVLVGGRQPPA